jgi:hypothetical protein
VAEKRDRVTSLTINNLPESLVGEVLECLREYFGTDAVEINLSDQRYGPNGVRRG